MLRMLDRHAVHALLEAGQSTNDIVHQFGVSRRTIQRIAEEPRVEDASDAEARRRRGVGRPAVPEPVRLQLRDALAADPEAPPLEYLRQLRD
jgi:transposase